MNDIIIMMNEGIAREKLVLRFDFKEITTFLNIKTYIIYKHKKRFQK